MPHPIIVAWSACADVSHAHVEYVVEALETWLAFVPMSFVRT